MKLYVINRNNERIHLDFGDTKIKTRKDIPYLFCVNCKTFNRDKVHIEEDKEATMIFIFSLGIFGFLTMGPIGAMVGAIFGVYFGFKRQKEDRDIVKNFDS